MMRLLLLAALLLFAAPAFADGQWQPCSTGHLQGPAIQITPGQSPALRPSPQGPSALCWDTNATDNSGIIVTSACDHVDAWVFNMTDGTTDDIAAQIHVCPSQTDTSNCIVAENLTLNGNPSTNTESIQGLGAEYVRISVETNTFPDDIRVHLRCNKL